MRVNKRMGESVREREREQEREWHRENRYNGTCAQMIVEP